MAIARRIERAENGNLGDVKPVGAGVSEMRIDMGAGLSGLLHHAREDHGDLIGWWH